MASSLGHVTEAVEYIVYVAFIKEQIYDDE